MQLGVIKTTCGKRVYPFEPPPESAGEEKDQEAGVQETKAAVVREHKEEDKDDNDDGRGKQPAKKKRKRTGPRYVPRFVTRIKPEDYDRARAIAERLALLKSLGHTEQVKQAEKLLSLASEDQMLIVDAFLRGEDMFATGSAGVGKTFCLTLLLALSIPTRTLKMASAGRPASQFGGSTVHSVYALGLAEGLIEKLVNDTSMNPAKQQLICNTETQFCDEISMLTGKVFTCIDWSGRRIRNLPDTPFGGIQTIVFGDFLQLPSIPERGKTSDLIFFSESWKAWKPRVFQLDKVFRQQDPTFVRLLQRIRFGICSASDRKLLRGRENFVFPDDGILPTRLYSHKKDANLRNLEELAKIHSDPYMYVAYDTGKEPYLKRLQEGCQSPAYLELKAGAQVLLTRNLDVEGGLTNGSSGVVLGFAGRDEYDALVARVGCGSMTLTAKQYFQGLGGTASPLDPPAIDGDAEMAAVVGGTAKEENKSEKSEKKVAVESKEDIKEMKPGELAKLIKTHCKGGDEKLVEQRVRFDYRSAARRPDEDGMVQTTMAQYTKKPGAGSGSGSGSGLFSMDTSLDAGVEGGDSPPTEVVNVNKGDDYDVYIGRRNPKYGESMFGNPSRMMGNDERERERVIGEYRNYFYKRVEEDSDFRNAALDLKGKRLGCFCAPDGCHGDVIVEWLDEQETLPRVDISDNPKYPVVLFSNGRVEFIGAEMWSSNVGEEEMARRIQVPLLLAWAVTIHKSQGQSLDRAQMLLDKNVFAKGQAYVALSRVRSLEGVCILGSFDASCIKTCNDAKRFYMSHGTDPSKLLDAGDSWADTTASSNTGAGSGSGSGSQERKGHKYGSGAGSSEPAVMRVQSEEEKRQSKAYAESLEAFSKPKGAKDEPAAKAPTSAFSWSSYSKRQSDKLSVSSESAAAQEWIERGAKS